MRITDEMLDEATDLIVTTRDFCGDERTAVLELAAEAGLNRRLALVLYKAANFRANARWNTFQKAAGVNPEYTF